MNRLYNKHTKRSIVTLDGLWQFKVDPKKEGLENHWFESLPEDAMDVVVPSCWHNEIGLYDYEGLAWYSTTFTTQDEPIQLLFHGVSGMAHVYLDGVEIGTHYGGFTGFECVVETIKKGDHTLVVSVDNTHDARHTIPLAKVDWFHYGGITRSVEVMSLHETWIDSCRIHYTINENHKDVLLDVDVTIRSTNKMIQTKELCIYMNNKVIAKTWVTIHECTTVNVRAQVLKDIKLWHPSNPVLYDIKCDIGHDDTIERIGFRKIEVKHKKLYLNGQPLYLKGINRHEDHPDWGFAMPLKLMKKDIDIIKDLGCNMIRGSHYPNAPVFLDLCDREGILFWEEIPMWGFPEEALKNPLVMERGLMMHEEMVTRDYHHPCIILWGMHNEIATDTKAGYTMTKAFAEKVRSLDSTRPITYASNRPIEDMCYTLVDIISVNKYCGWYEGGLEHWVPFIKALKEKLNNEHVADKPIIMSEFGAGAIYGQHTLEGPKWSENYQTAYLDYTLPLFQEDPDIIGSCIWQYCDIRTAKEMEMKRPRSFNNKGILDEYRRPKLAYWTVQKHYGHNKW